MTDALGDDLDAYLDRELFVGEPVEVQAPEPVPAVSEHMRALLDLAAREEAWLETLPPPPSPAASVEPEEARAATLAAEAASIVLPNWLKPDPNAPVPAVPAQAAEPGASHAPRVESCGTAAPWGSAAGMDATGLPATPWSVPVVSTSPADVYAPPQAWGGGAWQDDTSPGPRPVGGGTTQVEPFRAMNPAALPPGYAYPGLPPQAHAQHPWGLAAVAPAEPQRIAGMKPGAFLGAAAVGALAAGLLVVAGLKLYTSSTEAGMRERTANLASSASASMAQSTVQAGRHGVASVPGTQEGTAENGAAPVDALTTAPVMVPPPPASGVATAPVSGAQPSAGTTTPEGTASAPGLTTAQQAVVSVASTVLSTPEADVQAAAKALTPDSARDTLTVRTPATVASEPVLASATPRAVGTGRKGGAKGSLVRTTALDMEEGTASSTKAEQARDEDTTSDEEDSSAVSFESDSQATDEAETKSDTKVASADVTAEDVKPESLYSELDEDFARQLGFTEDAETKAEDTGAKKTVYIPPDPTVASQERLSPDDVTKVVVMNQPAITACIQQFKAGTAVANGGRFLVRWTVHPSGGVTDVSMETEALRHTSLGRCIEDQVRGWKFPLHRVALDAPIRFPFVF